MAIVQAVILSDLGSEFDIGIIEANKIHVQLGNGLQRSGLGVISVKPSDLVSTDAGQRLTTGTDGKLLIDTEIIQDAVGAAIAAGTGLTYDDALNAITSYFSNLAASDTTSIDISFTNGASPTLSAALIVDPDGTNLLSVGASGAKVLRADVLTSLQSGAGDTLAGTGLSVSGTTADRLLGAGDVTYSLNLGGLPNAAAGALPGTDKVAVSGATTTGELVSFAQLAAAIYSADEPAVQTTKSITGTGETGSLIQLSGDVAAPGNNYYYGTDGTGTKGFFTLPSVSYTASLGVQLVGSDFRAKLSTLASFGATPAVGDMIAMSGGDGKLATGAQIVAWLKANAATFGLTELQNSFGTTQGYIIPA